MFWTLDIPFRTGFTTYTLRMACITCSKSLYDIRHGYFMAEQIAFHIVSKCRKRYFTEGARIITSVSEIMVIIVTESSANWTIS
jgi:hypothetical protein